MPPPPDERTPLDQAGLDALAEELKILTEIREIKEKIDLLHDEDIEKLLKRADLETKLKEQIKDIIALREKSILRQQTEIEKAQTLLKIYSEHTDTLDGKILAQEQTIKIAEMELRLWDSIAKQSGLGADEVTKKRKELEKNLVVQKLILENLQRWTSSLEESVAAAKAVGTSLGKSGQIFESQFVQKGHELLKVFQGYGTSIKEMGRAFAMSAATSMVNNMVGLSFQLVNTEAGFRKATGASTDMAHGVTEVYRATRLYGVTAKEASEATQALFTTYTDFTMLSKSSQKTVAETSAVLGKMGVQHADFAKGVQISTKALGMSTETAEYTQRELTTFAKELGVAPQQMAADFAQAGNMMAKMGDQGVQAFKDLEHVFKITGMEMQKILAVTNQFDTFEGAAEQAGKLNAALGGNFVNAMDLMMTTDPAERFNMIRDSILNTGLTFDDMSYYQKNFYKDALGLSDVGDLAMMLSGNMDDLSGVTQKSADDLIELKKQAQSVQSVQEKLNAAIASATPIILPFLNLIISVTDALAENEDLAIAVAWGIGLAAVAYIGLAVWMKLTAFQAARSTIALGAENIARGTQVGLTGAQITALQGLSAAQIEAAMTSGAAGTAAGTASVGFRQMGIAVLMIGAGIGIAALGIAAIAWAFGKTGENADAAATAIGYFIGGFVLMVGILAGLVASGAAEIAAAAVLGLAAVVAALGLAMLLAGVGVAIFALGVSQLIDAINSIEEEKVAVLNKSFATLGFYSAGLVAVVPSLYGIAAGFSRLGDALKGVNTVKLKAIRKTFEMFNVELLLGILAAKNAINALSVELDKISEPKLVMVTVAMGSMAALAAFSALPETIAAMAGGMEELSVTAPTVAASVDELQAAQLAPQAAAVQATQEHLTQVTQVSQRAPEPTGIPAGLSKVRQPLIIQLDKEKVGKAFMEYWAMKGMEVNLVG